MHFKNIQIFAILDCTRSHFDHVSQNRYQLHPKGKFTVLTINSFLQTIFFVGKEALFSLAYRNKISKKIFLICAKHNVHVKNFFVHFVPFLFPPEILPVSGNHVLSKEVLQIHPF